MKSIILSCCIPDWFVIINVQEKTLFNLINKIFSNLIAENTCNILSNNILNIKIHTTLDEYTIVYQLNQNDENNYSCKKINDVVFFVCILIENYTDSLKIPNCSIFHGGALSKNGKAYGISASTKSGKSTLIAYLSNNGYNYLADDHIIMERSSHIIYPFPIPISLRDKAPLPVDIHKNIVFHGYNIYTNEYNYLFLNHNKYLFRKSSKLHAMLFINRCNHNSITHLNKSESYKKLLLNLKNSNDLDYELKHLLRLINSVDCYLINYCDMSYVKNIIDKLNK